ncbi:hypothetical protein ACFS6H_16505 [Terrimonas rubra]|uniref:Uncharacterized protein n=1 Tax=Terrimonas rubra TaxID=1035890 RepID=A0ABW6A7J5_9BACT
MAFLWGLFKSKAGGTWLGNLLRATIPIVGFIPHRDDAGNWTSTGHQIIDKIKDGLSHWEGGK